MTSDRTLPTEGELIDLPFFAILVLAVRCAHRVEPLFVKFWVDAPLEHVEAVRHAIQAVENLAANPRGSLWKDAGKATLRAADAAAAADLADAPESAVHAADAAAELAGAIQPERTRTLAARAAIRSVRASAQALAGSGAGNQREFYSALHEDLQTLRAYAGSQQWTDKTAVSLRILDSP